MQSSGPFARFRILYISEKCQLLSVPSLDVTLLLKIWNHQWLQHFLMFIAIFTLEDLAIVLIKIPEVSQFKSQT
jgi:hypothetical protein